MYFRDNDDCGQSTTDEIMNTKLMNSMRMDYQSCI